MNFVDFLNISLPIILYTIGIVVLVILIIIGIKIIKTINKVENIVKDIDDKVKSLNKIFEIIDITTDKLSLFTEKSVDLIIKILKSVFKKKRKEITDEEEE